MKRILLLTALLGMAFLTATGQESESLKIQKETQKESRKEMRQERRMQMRLEEEKAQEEAYQKAIAALDKRDFVIEIDKLSFSGYPTIFCTEFTNFISFHDGESVVQITLDNHNPRQNGIGGITLKGRPTELTDYTTKDETRIVSMQIQGIAISAKIDINMVKGDNYVTVKLSSTYAGKVTTIYGKLVPWEESSVFQGTPL